MAAEPLIRAAGAVLWRADGGELEVALVHRPRYDDWSLPKGKAKHGEHILRTVVREVREETGVTARLGAPLPSASYEVNGRPKRVDYWAAEAVDVAPFKPDHEVDELAWTPVPVALGLLTHQHDAALLRAFVARPRPTRSVIVLRHACAGEKRFWHGSDLLRPLDARGRWESTALTPMLAAYAPTRIVSSATARCVETILDYAVAHALPITTDAAFTVGAPPDACPPADRLRTLLSASPDPLLICTHGEHAPTLHTALTPTPPTPPTLRKAAFWTFHLNPTGTIQSIEHHTPHPT
ncbi:NUDIX hydrolase [Actinocorallia sp. API 0066]|uniref:NUDIX hydrolase n=1 Tax=Actinocorallia sp. API 0066 TaxID=2896846 RepID=UPI002107B771|nr:NUDIX hydrolase [Actinocorallia sp. API 0066]